MNCFVTGGTGLVGSNLVAALLEHGHDVVITGHEAEQRLPNFSGKILYPSFIGIDWQNIGKFDVLFHQAALNDTRFLDRKEMIRANVDSSIALFEQVIRRGCKRIIYASSTAVYGRNPAPYTEKGPFDLNTPYAESKKLLEELAELKKELAGLCLQSCLGDSELRAKEEKFAELDERAAALSETLRDLTRKRQLLLSQSAPRTIYNPAEL